MGFEIKRFQGEVDEEFICPICTGVLEDPLQAPACEHAFCRACITEWVSSQPTCPVDRQPVTASQLRPVPRLLRNLLSRLCTSCDYAPHGCNAVLQLEFLASHLVECEFNPKRPTPCEAGCGLVAPKDELAEHNCVRELRAVIATHEQELAELKRELAPLKDFMREMRLSNPSTRAPPDQMEREEVVRWANSLPRARVADWRYWNLDPSDVLKNMIKGSLSESGCPPHLLDALMENCRYGRWPPGFRFPLINNNYVCKRVPGLQAVVILHCDNTHVDMKVKPGFVVIYSSGVV